MPIQFSSSHMPAPPPTAGQRPPRARFHQPLFAAHGLRTLTPAQNREVDNTLNAFGIDTTDHQRLQTDESLQDALATLTPQDDLPQSGLVLQTLKKNELTPHLDNLRASGYQALNPTRRTAASGLTYTTLAKAKTDTGTDTPVLVQHRVIRLSKQRLMNLVTITPVTAKTALPPLAPPPPALRNLLNALNLVFTTPWANSLGQVEIPATQLTLNQLNQRLSYQLEVGSELAQHDDGTPFRLGDPAVAKTLLDYEVPGLGQVIEITKKQDERTGQTEYRIELVPELNKDTPFERIRLVDSAEPKTRYEADATILHTAQAVPGDVLIVGTQFWLTLPAHADPDDTQITEEE